MNLKYFPEIEGLAPLLAFKVAAFDRREEPPEVKVREGATLAWGVASVLKAGEAPPDVIYDRGEWGKEPMLRLLGPTPMAVAEKALALKNAMLAAGKL
jgi:predicted fused transcriptional regulator/phosphomethylpyrimidine kinase